MVYVVVGGLVFGGPDGLRSCWWFGVRWPRWFT